MQINKYANFKWLIIEKLSLKSVFLNKIQIYHDICSIKSDYLSTVKARLHVKICIIMLLS